MIQGLPVRPVRSKWRWSAVMFQRKPRWRPWPKILQKARGWGGCHKSRLPTSPKWTGFHYCWDWIKIIKLKYCCFGFDDLWTIPGYCCDFIEWTIGFWCFMVNHGESGWIPHRSRTSKLQGPCVSLLHLAGALADGMLAALDREMFLKPWPQRTGDVILKNWDEWKIYGDLWVIYPWKSPEDLDLMDDVLNFRQFRPFERWNWTVQNIFSATYSEFAWYFGVLIALM